MMRPLALLRSWGGNDRPFSAFSSLAEFGASLGVDSLRPATKAIISEPQSLTPHDVTNAEAETMTCHAPIDASALSKGGTSTPKPWVKSTKQWRQRQIRRSRTRLFELLIGTIAMSGLAPVIANAQTSGSGAATLTISVEPPPVRSVTVSSSTLSYAQCTRAGSSTPRLTFPNGLCRSTFSLTIGPAPSRLRSEMTLLTSPTGTSWANCVCSTPGTDQFGLYESYGSAQSGGATRGIYGALKQTQPTILTFSHASGDVGGEVLPATFYLFGPAASTSAEGTWTHTVSWTALPL